MSRLADSTAVVSLEEASNYDAAERAIETEAAEQLYVVYSGGVDHVETWAVCVEAAEHHTAAERSHGAVQSVRVDVHSNTVS